LHVVWPIIKGSTIVLAVRKETPVMRTSGILLMGWIGALPLSALAAEPLTYEKHIRPIFRAHCFDCHGATDDGHGRLDLRLVRFMTKGGDSGPAIVPGKPDESYLLYRMQSGEMPPGEGKVSDEEIQTMER